MLLEYDWHDKRNTSPRLNSAALLEDFLFRYHSLPRLTIGPILETKRQQTFKGTFLAPLDSAMEVPPLLRIWF